MTTALYASLSAFLIFWLSMNVIKKRRLYKVSLGDGGNEELKTAVAAHLNAVEYIPITLLLLFTLEYNKANIGLLHGLGLVFMIGRIIHARGLLQSRLKQRVMGMQITLYTLIILAILNIVYLPYSQLFSF